eukprot:gnl/MRDRNA2_/MRDRNA2_226508_c0_seq1.p1 gnl/MRDRNA2_/MRDRNA2_226508_c0~~gnl/MRDRNA2_/MRDRNA2_226508_c0_seq1.p1  ORF type:complete len:286 (+),score=44.83 gnl/MRDRNA2_/MRDRNA2_226508_c0_seq1:1-858(+)
MIALGDHPVLLSYGIEGGAKLQERENMLFLLSYAVWVLARWGIGYPILTGASTVGEIIKKILNPPVIACLVGGGVGICWSLVPLTARPGETAFKVLSPVLTAVDYSGRCTVPMILFALGARLDQAIREVGVFSERKAYQQVDKPANTESNGKVEPEVVGLPSPITEKVSVTGREAHQPGEGAENEPENMPIPAYVAVLLLRQAVGPLFGTVVAFGLLQGMCGVEDPVILLVAMLQSAGPPMINLSVMAGISGTAERETAKLLLLTYSASILSWTASIAFFLELLK